MINLDKPEKMQNLNTFESKRKSIFPEMDINIPMPKNNFEFKGKSIFPEMNINVPRPKHNDNHKCGASLSYRLRAKTSI